MRVFISSTFKDLEEYREAAFRAVQRMAGQADDMVFWSADEREPAEVSVSRVRQSDVLLLIIAHRYGYVPPDGQRSITELEYRAARESGTPVLAFIVDERTPWPPAEIEWEKRAELDRFKSTVQREVTSQTFASPDELHALITQALALFAQRRRESLASTKSLRTRAAPVHPAATLERLPDLVLQIGVAEDGLPLLLRVRRSRDIAPHLDALADVLGRDEAPLALLDQFRQALEQHATERWTRHRIRDVRLRNGASIRMYVSAANLGGLTASLLSRVLTESTETVEEPAASPAVRTLMVSAQSETRRLESVGGQNRFLGVSLADGRVYSVGRQGQEVVEWRPYIFESIRAAFPDARYAVGVSSAPAVETDAAGYAGEVKNWAVAQLERSQHLRIGSWLVLSRQSIAHAIVQIARTLAAEHRLGRVHADLKPANILLTDAGPVLIDDFGLTVGERSPGWTPEWSAPEQVMGASVATATDIYPLGMMLCRLLGALPVGEIRKFRIPPMPDGRMEYDLLYNPLPALPASAALTPRDLLPWISFAGNCLRFRPEERPATADAFADLLEALLEGNPLPGTIKIRLAVGDFTPATLVDGTDCIARMLEDEATDSGEQASSLLLEPEQRDSEPGWRAED